ncbi:toll like receptor isoform X2 [Anticarsia gemmatalis]
MRLFLLLLLLSGSLALHPQCDAPIINDGVSYECRVGRANVTFEARHNDHVTITCEGTDFTCSDLPLFDFGSSLPLRSVGLKSCSPSILRCVYHVINASAAETIALTDMRGELGVEDVEGLRGVRNLFMRMADAQKTFPIAAIKALPELKNLRINGGQFQLSPDMFVGVPPLKYLELSECAMTGIPEGTFNGLASLTGLNLFSNNYDAINVGAFKGLNNVTTLTLNTHSHLKTIPPGVLTDLPKLTNLVIIGNVVLDSLPDGVFDGLEMLADLKIQLNRVPLTLGSKALSNLPSLKNLTISGSLVTTFPENLLNGSRNIEKLDFSYNKIDILHPRALWTQKSLKYLNLSNNKIKILQKEMFLPLKKLELLNLENNGVQELSDYLFSGPTNLKEINLNNNKISSIAWTAFQGVTKLEVLNLNSNNLSLTPEIDYESFETYSPFESLTQLRVLQLKNNRIKTIFDDWRLVLTKLETLDLSWNRFELLPYQLAFLSQKIIVDLRYNHIRHISLDPRLFHSNDTRPPTAQVLLENNPLVCDCDLYGLRLRLNGGYMDSEPKFVLNNAPCTSPDNLKGVIIKNLNPELLVCEIPEEKPENCESCVAKVATNELVLTCPVLPNYLPNSTREYFIDTPTVTLNLATQPDSLKDFNIHTLNLSRSNMEKVIFKPVKSLKILDLSYNNLSYIPMEFLDNNIHLYLKNNPLECSCWYQNDIRRLKNYEFLKDYEEITCENGILLSEIDVTELCNTRDAIITGVSTFLGLAILVVFACLLIYKFWYEILIYVTSRGLCKCCITEIMLDSERDFDIFLSFSHQDFPIIKNVLLPKLENNFGQKCCVHYRDWIIGESIPDQIRKSVLISRKTIILLSKNFLESNWANFEFWAAHNLAIQEGRSRVILILLEENLVKNENLSPELKGYINTNTYLLFDDPKFWEKLQKVLPRKVYKFTWLDVFKQKSRSIEEEKIMNCGLNVQLNSEGKLINLAAKDVEGGIAPKFV